MNAIVERCIFAVGRFTVVQRPRIDSPGWGQYLVYLKDLRIGACFSVPDLDACEWLYRQMRDDTFYAYGPVKLQDVRVGVVKPRHIDLGKSRYVNNRVRRK